MDTICQVLPNMEYGDAVSNYALLIDHVLRQAGYRTKLFAQFVHAGARRVCQPLSRAAALLGSDKNVWLYHYTTSSPATQMMRQAAGPVAMVYHNVTPAHFVAYLGGGFAARAFAGRQELAAFAAVPSAVAAISEYNARDLEGLGIAGARVIPLTIDFSHFDQKPDRSLLAALREQKTVNFLTVGRLAPHKRVEDVIKVFYYYHNYINPRSRLYVVGDGEEYSPYAHQLLQLRTELAIPNILFTGKIRFRELLAYYHASDIYLCMSEHEGFCVPLLEAMYLGVPVIANACDAIAETMGNAGILVREKRADVIAEAADLLVRDPKMRTTVTGRQKERAADFHIERLADSLIKLLTDARDVHRQRRAAFAVNGSAYRPSAPDAPSNGAGQ